MMKLPNKQPKQANPDFDTVRKLLPTFSAQEIRELRLLLDTYYVAPEAATSRDGADWLLSGVRDELCRRGLGCPPLTRKFVNGLAPDAQTQAAAVRDTMATSMQRRGRSLSTAQWLGLGRVCAKSLAKLIESWEVLDKKTQTRKPVRVSAQTMLLNIWKVPEALDAGFPGYLESGLLDMIVRERRPDAAQTNSDDVAVHVEATDEDVDAGDDGEVHHDEHADDWM
jgi:hypothetical protein